MASWPESAGSGRLSLQDLVRALVTELGELQLALGGETVEGPAAREGGTSEVAELAKSHARRVCQQELFVARTGKDGKPGTPSAMHVGCENLDFMGHACDQNERLRGGMSNFRASRHRAPSPFQSVYSFLPCQRRMTS